MIENFRKFLRPAKQNRKRSSQTQSGFEFEKLEDRQLLAADLTLVGSGLSGYFDALQTQVSTEVFNASIPVAGDQIAESNAGQFLNGLKARADNVNIFPSDNIAAAKAKIQSAFGSLIVTSGTDPIRVIGNDASDQVRFQFTLGGTATDRLDLDLALGSDAVAEIRVGGEDTVDLNLNWTIDVNFLIQDVDPTGNTSQFRAEVAAQDEIHVAVSAILNNSRFSTGYGPLGVFVGQFHDQSISSERVTRFDGNYQIDIRSDSGLLVVSDRSDIDVAGRLTGTGQANFRTEGAFVPDSVNDSLFNLKVDSDLSIQYLIANDSTEVYAVEPSTGEIVLARQMGSAPVIEYSNVRLDVGEFYNGFLKPTVGAVQEYLQPFKPITDFLTTEIPVISDLYKVLDPEAEITPLTLAGRLSFGDSATQQQINNTIKAIKLINNILAFDLSPTETSNQMLDLGRIKFSYGPSILAPSDPASSPTSTIGGTTTVTALNQVNNPEANLDPEESGKTRDFMAELGASFDIPILGNPALAFDLLLGKSDPQLFTAAVDFAFNFDFTKEFPVPGIPGLFANLGFNFGAAINLDVGYDAFGAAKYSRLIDYSDFENSAEQAKFLLEDGFYFDDHNEGGARDGDVTSANQGLILPAGGNKEAPEAVLKIGATAGASIGADLLVFSVSAGVNINLNTVLNFDFNDLPTPTGYDADTFAPIYAYATPNDYQYDGRVRLSEFQKSADSSPAAVLNSSGELIAGLTAFVEAKVLGFTVLDLNYTLYETVIFDFDIYSPDDTFIITGGRVNPPVFGAVNNSGGLQLYAGPTSHQRANTNSDRTASDNSDNEEFYIRAIKSYDDGSQDLEVTFRPMRNDGSRIASHRQIFEGVRSINFDGGDGKDKIVIGESVQVSAILKGGDGEDTLIYAGTGTADISGGKHNDLLIGGSNHDILRGNEGNDQMIGGGGNDHLTGGEGNDRMEGGRGTDNLDGESGVDTYFWKAGDGSDQLRDSGLGDDNQLIVQGGVTSAGLAGNNDFNDTIELNKSPNGANEDYRILGNGDVLTVKNIRDLTISSGKGADSITVNDLGALGLSSLILDVGSSNPGGQGVTVEADENGSTEFTTNATTTGLGDGSKDTVTFNGTDDADQIVVTPNLNDPDQVRLTFNGSVTVDIVNSTAGQDELIIDAKGGADSVDVDSNRIDIRVLGGAGDDVLSAAYSNVFVDGGLGNDTFTLRDDGEAGALSLTTSGDSRSPSGPAETPNWRVTRESRHSMFSWRGKRTRCLFAEPQLPPISSAPASRICFMLKTLDRPPASTAPTVTTKFALAKMAPSGK